MNLHHIGIRGLFFDLYSAIAGNPRYLAYRDIFKSMTEAEEETIVGGATRASLSPFFLASYAPAAPDEPVEISSRQYIFAALSTSLLKRGRPLVCRSALSTVPDTVLLIVGPNKGACTLYRIRGGLNTVARCMSFMDYIYRFFITFVDGQLHTDQKSYL